MNSQLESWNWFHKALRQPTGVKTVETPATIEEVSEMSDQDLQSDLVEYRTISWLHNQYVNRLKAHHAKIASEYGRKCVGDLIMSVTDGWLDSSLASFGDELIRQPDNRFGEAYTARPCDSGE